MRSLLMVLLLNAALFARAASAGDEVQAYDVRAAFAESDTNGDGEIDLCEFQTRITEVFYQADGDKDGYLSLAEYKRLPFSGEFKEADLDGNGKLTLHDFMGVRYRLLVDADTNRDGALSLEEVRTAYEGKRPQ